MNVEDLLKKQDLYFMQKGADYLIKCINPEHDDNNPSLRVDRVTGVFNCFSCGFKGNLFKHFGEKVNQLDLRKELIKRKIADKVAESVGLLSPEDAIPYITNYRDIKPSTYKEFKAFQSAEKDYVGRVVFPITDLSGRVVAHIGRHTTGGEPRYLVVPPKAKLPVFPAASPIMGRTILVEGIFDMLNLRDKGLDNAVCIFGTNAFNEDKLAMLRMQGTTDIDIFLDGDEAGQKAAKKIKSLCEENEVPTRNIHLEGRDPGSLTETEVLKLKKQLYDS